MTLLEVVTRVCDDSNVKLDIAAVKARIIRNINRVCSDVWDGFRWTFRQRNYPIVTDIDVTAGTVTATNGSYTITGSGTTFLSSHPTWHIYFPGDSIINFYKIRKYTSATQLELDVPYQGTTGSSKTYILRHFDYVLPTEITDLESVSVPHQNKIIPITEASSLEVFDPAPQQSGYPTAVSIYSSNTFPTVLSTGTVAGTINTNTITGSSTTWLSDSVQPGDLLTIGSYSYTIYSVDTDTQLTLYNYQQVTTAGGTSYTITRQFGRILRIIWPSNSKYVLSVRGLRKYAPLVNDSDTNELLNRYPNMVILKSAAIELRSQNDKRAGQLTQESEMKLQIARAEDDALTNKESVGSVFSYRKG